MRRNSSSAAEGKYVNGGAGKILALLQNEATQVAPVFPSERVGFIFRMALKEQELAIEGLRERVHAMGWRIGKNVVSRKLQVFGRQIVVPGVGNEASRSPRPDERMAPGL